MLTLNKCHTIFYCSSCWLWASKCQLVIYGYSEYWQLLKVFNVVLKYLFKCLQLNWAIVRVANKIQPSYICRCWLSRCALWKPQIIRYYVIWCWLFKKRDNPVDTGRKLNVHKTFKRRRRRQDVFWTSYVSSICVLCLLGTEEVVEMGFFYLQKNINRKEVVDFFKTRAVALFAFQKPNVPTPLSIWIWEMCKSDPISWTLSKQLP